MELFIRSDFIRRSYDTDIALIRMDREVSFNNLIRPVCLPSMVEELDGMEGTVVGRGLLKEKGEIPDGLHAIRLPVIPQTVCKLTSRHRKNSIIDNMFCAGYMDGRGDACQGDSGGPFLMTAHDAVVTQVGIVSWGIGCARRGFPGVYTRLAIYLPWIVDILKSSGSCVCGRVRAVRNGSEKGYSKPWRSLELTNDD